MKFKVHLEERLTWEYEVEAEDEEQAKEIFHEKEAELEPKLISSGSDRITVHTY